MKTLRAVLIVSMLSLLLSGCATTVKLVEAEVKTHPTGAKIYIDNQQISDVTPFTHTFDFTQKKEYKLIVEKEGYFQKEFIVSDKLASLEEGQVRIKLEPSPLWKATTKSPATNNWLQILVGEGLDTRSTWQFMLDTVIKRSIAINELNYEAGYLQTKYTLKRFDTVNGEFLLRCQLVANLVSVEPVMYRLKVVSEWSGDGINWYPYNRILVEHAMIIQEIQDRLRAG